MKMIYSVKFYQKFIYSHGNEILIKKIFIYKFPLLLNITSPNGNALE